MIAEVQFQLTIMLLHDVFEKENFNKVIFIMIFFVYFQM